jgi:hypothetical protein
VHLNGVEVHFIAALPTLLKIAKRGRREMRQVLQCSRHPSLHPSPPGARAVAILNWSVCPLDIIEAGHLQALQRLQRVAAVAPIAPWPGAFAAWVVEGLAMLQQSEV